MIHTKRKAALDLMRRGLITQTEAAKLLGESRQAVGYMAREIACKAARNKYLNDLWKETTK
jgi:hypothetical protein